jgi:hypothetical protein
MLMRIKSGVCPEIGMAKRVANSGSSYSDSTKQSIAKEVLLRPGQTGRQIAHRLNLDRSRVNSFLYGEGKNKFGLTLNHWRWYDLTRDNGLLDERLKAELAMRRAELLSASQPAKQPRLTRSNLWLWALLILAGIWILNSFGSGNDHKNRVPKTENVR